MENPHFYDCHTHTHFSHDSGNDPLTHCRTAIEKGLSGVAFTDHCDVQFLSVRDEAGSIRRSVAAAEELRRCFAGQLTVMSGVEIGESIWDPAAAENILHMCEYDVVLASVHAVRQTGVSCASLDFSLGTPASEPVFSDEALHRLLTAYFDEVLETLQAFDFDVLPHLTYPFRYINGKYGRGIALSPYMPQIDAILDGVIEKGIALEVNTSGVGTPFDRTMPDAAVLGVYYARGGRRITLGSDAHTAENAGRGFAGTAAMLKKIGFRQAVYYQKREAIAYDL